MKSFAQIDHICGHQFTTINGLHVLSVMISIAFITDLHFHNAWHRYARTRRLSRDDGNKSIDVFLHEVSKNWQYAWRVYAWTFQKLTICFFVWSSLMRMNSYVYFSKWQNRFKHCVEMSWCRFIGFVIFTTYKRTIIDCAQLFHRCIVIFLL